MKINRNDPCHCGSEKKYKDCHGKQVQSESWKKILIYVGIAIVLIWFAMDLFSLNKSSITSAPPGKVWSEEHGHYHDINPVRTVPQQSLNIPKPEGPAPPGKVWSEEHGHWHDIQK
tara:strand:- start:204 stop:551 length:348 start_codon:yes stop_codon:yes gene_type:complete